MNTRKFSINIYIGLSILLFCIFGLTGCGKSETVVVEPHTPEVNPADTPVTEAGAGEIGTGELEIEPSPSPATLMYTNQDYGFEFEYPGTWNLSEGLHDIVLTKGPNRLGIRFRWVDEEFDPYSGRTGIPAGDLIYKDKLLFMDQVIPAEYLIFEKKYKAVFYNGISWIEVDDLLFLIELADLETGDYYAIDLSDELLTEAKSIVESFKRIDKADASNQSTNATETGLAAYLQLPERLTIGESINLKFVLKNNSDTPLYILNWYTPLEGIGGKIFKVTHDGQAVPYEGILASRSSPTGGCICLIESLRVSVRSGRSSEFI